MPLPSPTHMAILKAVNYFMSGAKVEDYYGDGISYHKFKPVHPMLIQVELLGSHDDLHRALADLVNRKLLMESNANALEPLTYYREDGCRVDIDEGEIEELERPILDAKVQGVGITGYEWCNAPGYTITTAGFALLDEFERGAVTGNENALDENVPPFDEKSALWVTSKIAATIERVSTDTLRKYRYEGTKATDNQSGIDRGRRRWRRVGKSVRYLRSSLTRVSITVEHQPKP